MTRARRFSELQRGLADLPPGPGGRDTVVALPSLNLGAAYHVAHDTPALEERWLYLALHVRDPAARVVVATSLAVPEPWLAAYLDLLPGVPDARARLTAVSADDPYPGPLAEKFLARPAALERLRAAIGDPGRAYIVPFNVDEVERELALALGVPIYGIDPELAPYGTKTGGRRLFAQEGVPAPAGAEGLHGAGEVAGAIAGLRAERPGLERVVVKLDDGTLGDGNAIVALGELPAPGGPGEDAAVRGLLQRVLTPEYRAQLAARRSVVEELVDGAEVHSPSVQLLVEPRGAVRILSTHDQLLAGPLGHTFAGARFPADPRYGAAIVAAAGRVGARLARERIVGRCAVDFVVVSGGDGAWDVRAVEINLREGATTHPLGTLELLTGGAFDADAGVFRLPDGSERCYEASDVLRTPGGRAVPAQTLLEGLRATGLAYDPTDGTGVVVHMLRALERDGQLSAVAIARDREGAATLYAALAALLDELAAAEAPAARDSVVQLGRAPGLGQPAR